MPEESRDIIKRQLRFFTAKQAGCLFAAAAARHPVKHGWMHRIVIAECGEIDMHLAQAIADPATAMVSLLFPDVTTPNALVGLIGVLKQCALFDLEQCEEFGGTLCLGFRAEVGDLRSYVTGFGNFPFLPATRRAPYVELAIRVKPRPPYEFVFKEAPPNVIHLADLDMLGMDRTRLGNL